MQFGQLKRREFITLLGGAAAAWPIAVQAQQTPEVPRVGFVYSGSKAAAAPRMEAILSGLRVSGYAAPAQVEIVARTAEGDPAQIVPLVRSHSEKCECDHSEWPHGTARSSFGHAHHSDCRT